MKSKAQKRAEAKQRQLASAKSAATKVKGAGKGKQTMPQWWNTTQWASEGVGPNDKVYGY